MIRKTDILFLSFLLCSYSAFSQSDSDSLASIGDSFSHTDAYASPQSSLMRFDNDYMKSHLDAVRISDFFVRDKYRIHGWKEWENTKVKNVNPLWSLDSSLLAWEVEIVDAIDDSPKGWIIIEENENLPPILCYTKQGSTITEKLMGELLLQLGEDDFDKAIFRFLHTGSSNIILEYSIDRMNYSRISINPFSVEAYPSSEVREKVFFQNVPEEKYEKFKKDNKSQRLQLLKKEFTPVSEEVTVSTLSGFSSEKALKMGVTDFAHFYQKDLRWRNDTKGIYQCNSGCVPIAWVTVMEYWDRNGYPGMVGRPGDDWNVEIDDPDIIWAIDELRYELKTYCVERNGGARTSPGNYVDGVKHINSRGEGRWVSRKHSFRLWDKIKAQIDKGNPAILAYYTGIFTVHAGVIVEYTENRSDSRKNEITVIMGGKTEPVKTYIWNSMSTQALITIEED
ncbi:hypothetical protein [Acanthopleuribacter pedis]|uniref:Peptidase C39-like domain-containing protein n=1 Tax=Acanthopleuribacter pedis TaxID=442870 RepID=A0A8J7U706_9BACT|nr:hypothetical protein [Acanthopleuribacter pedis]MBO1321988.1 hypothetical protein [Acanthopleuribacter pedis]